MKKKGYVYLIGAGPGDIRLLTLKGLECLRKADVILYDRLVNPLLLEWTKPDAELIYCGKLPHRHLLRQDAINDLLVQHGLEGKTVVRLKGGDPSVFGRVGEEAAVLDEASIPYEIVPGVTAGIGAATYAGVPVTHRDHSASFAVITGHDKSESGQPTVDWKALATGIETIAFYMGIGNLEYISKQLLKYGRSPETPVLLIQWGTTGKQRTLAGTLATITNQAADVKFKNPAITLVGNVAKLRTRASWFERQRLFNQHILLGRTSDEHSKIAQRLREEGADVFEFPRWKTSMSSFESLNKTDYERILFLSPKSVQAFYQWLKERKIDIRSLKANFYGASSKSIQAIEQFACLAFLDHEMINEGDLLVLGGDSWLSKESEREKQWGKHDFIVTHRTTLVPQSERTCQRLLDEDRIKTIVFPSAHSVHAVTTSMAACGETPQQLSERANIICFGEKSAKAALEAGYLPAVVLSEPNIDALIQALI